jgi:hypothetical protein
VVEKGLGTVVVGGRVEKLERGMIQCYSSPAGL